MLTLRGDVSVMELLRSLGALAGIALILMLSSEIKAWARHTAERRNRHV